MIARVLLKLILILPLFAITACQAPSPLVDVKPHRALYLLPPDNLPVFTDDLDRSSLIECCRRQIAFLQKQPADKAISFGTKTYTNKWLRHSLESFLEKLLQKPSEEELRAYIVDNYLIYQAGGRQDQGQGQMLVTGYYEPLFQASLQREGSFQSPIHSLPASLISLPQANGDIKVGRYTAEGSFVDYWSRREIELDPSLLHRYQMAFLKDPFDAFLLHVQGSGKLQFPDKTIRSIRFAGSNGLPYKSIGKLLVDEGAMTLPEVTVPAIRGYLLQHPDQQQRILRHNPRYIFFKWGDDSGPKGSSGEILTPGRSIAIDSTALPGGSLGYLQTRVPLRDKDDQIVGWKALSRFVFPQDSGAAIKGSGRVDIFFGGGQDAEFAANHMKEDGTLYFLVKKNLIFSAY